MKSNQKKPEAKKIPKTTQLKARTDAVLYRQVEEAAAAAGESMGVFIRGAVREKLARYGKSK